jgi:hypothetical protein
MTDLPEADIRLLVEMDDADAPSESHPPRPLPPEEPTLDELVAGVWRRIRSAGSGALLDSARWSGLLLEIVRDQIERGRRNSRTPTMELAATSRRAADLKRELDSTTRLLRRMYETHVLNLDQAHRDEVARRVEERLYGPKQRKYQAVKPTGSPRLHAPVRTRVGNNQSSPPHQHKPEQAQKGRTPVAERA